MALVLTPSPVRAAEGDMCRDVLAGVFNTTQFQTGSADNEYFRKWQCSADFGNHDAAIASGLQVGVPVYGVPLKIGGTFDQSSKDSWKKSNCSEVETRANSTTATYQLIRSVSPETVSAWSKCMDLNTSVTALSCSLMRSGAGAVFSANWVRKVGEPDNAAPKISYFSVSGGACTRTLAVNATVGEAATQTNCSPAPESSLTVILDTQRGSCWKDLPAEVTTETVAGKVNLTAPRYIKADVVQFATDAVIVTNGNSLTIEAKKIKLSGNPRIVSFEGAAASGSNSQSAAPIIISARKIEGTALVIDNHGQDGSNGQAGDAGSKGATGAQGQQAGWDPLQGCHGRTSSSDGGVGGTGGPGHPGKAGGSAGSVTYSIADGLTQGPISRLTFITQRTDPRTNAVKTCIGSCGGFGGAGGARGDRGPGGDGGPSVPGTFHCGGGNAGGTGPWGAYGQLGQDGPDGPDGPIVRPQPLAAN